MRMNKKDGRALKHSTREEIRKRAVYRVLDGESPEDVIDSLGFHRSCIYEWLAKYREGGEQALLTNEIKGRPKSFPDEYADRLRDLIKQNPTQLDFHDALWTRDMIRDLLWSEFRVDVSERTVSNILKRFGITAQKPKLKAYEQDPKEVKEWLEVHWPAIRKEAKKRNAVVYFGDEAALRSEEHSGKTWGIKGETPVVPKTGQRYGINLISAISPQGRLRFMVTEKRVNADTFIEFLKRLLTNSDRPIFLILDGHPVHRSKKVKQFVESTKGDLTLYFLPKYSPELNPDELVWNYLKNGHTRRKIFDSKADMKLFAHSVLRSIQKNVDLLKRFFRETYVSYIIS